MASELLKTFQKIDKGRKKIIQELNGKGSSLDDTY